MYEPRVQVGSNKVMMRSNAPLSPLETKIDAFTNQLADLSLMIKKNQSRDEATAFRSVHDRTCSYCKRPGHGANRCDTNPHRDTKCPRCGTCGHSETSCWARVGTPRGGSSAYSRKKNQADSAVSGNPTGSAGNQVSVVTHEALPADEELVAWVKRNADGEPVAKARKDGGGEPISSLLNARKYWTPNHMKKPRRPVHTTKRRGRVSIMPSKSTQKSTMWSLPSRMPPLV